MKLMDMTFTAIGVQGVERFRCLIAVLVVVVTGVVGAEAPPFEVVAKAQPDEWVTPGQSRYVRFGRQPAGVSGVAKVNHDYVWGMAASRGKVWFGDVANIVCLAAATRPDNPLFGASGDSLYRMCDYDATVYPGVPRWLPPAILSRIGDWRPPDMWRFDPSANTLKRITPRDVRIFRTLGFRSVGATESIVFYAGPNLYAPGINLFAFNPRTGRYLGSTTLAAYSNIRRFVSVGSALYTTVENTGGGGSVLRWMGDVNHPFRFDVVGRLDSTGMYITEHQGRLYVTTWPSGEEGGTQVESGVLGGLWMSPEMPRDGLQAFHAVFWKKVWDVSFYEADALVAQTIGGGALASFGGDLYWGTMQLPGQGYETFASTFGTATGAGMILTNTTRALALFRSPGFENPTPVSLLYGDPSLPVYDPVAGTWSMQPNRTGPPLFGLSGFGNPNNSYTWSMEIHRGKLFVGTFDASTYLYGDHIVRRQPVSVGVGADLFQFPDSQTPAIPITQDGAGNPFNQGFRNMSSIGDDLFIGTASASNLRDLGNGQRGGGWELLRH